LKVEILQWNVLKRNLS